MTMICDLHTDQVAAELVQRLVAAGCRLHYTRSTDQLDIYRHSCQPLPCTDAELRIVCEHLRRLYDLTTLGDECCQKLERYGWPNGPQSVSRMH